MLSSFCGLLEIQVGVAILSGVFLTLAGVILAANIFDFDNGYYGFPISLILMIIFVVGLIIIGILMVASSYAEKRSLALAALALLFILFLYWLVLSLLSFFSGESTVAAVCIKLRCPETFWLANLRYRTFHNDTYYRPYYYRSSSTTTTTTTTTTEPPINPNWWPEWWREDNNQYFFKRDIPVYGVQSNAVDKKPDSFDNIITAAPKDRLHSMQENSKFRHMLDNEIQSSTTIEQRTYFEKNANIMKPTAEIMKKMIFLNYNNKDDVEIVEGPIHIFGLPLLGAIILFIINFIFLVFSALVLWSWASELDYADYYVEEEEEEPEAPIVVFKDDL